MHKQNTISACLVVYNEEKVIRHCLESIKDVVDEIIVVHDGECQDKTLEICSEYTDKIFVREHFGACETNRVFAFEQASGDWILQIDADEFLSDELKYNLRTLVNQEEFDGYAFLWKLWDGKEYRTKKWPFKLGLYRKTKMEYWGLLHNAVKINGKVKNSILHLEHRPLYNNYTFKIFKQKWLKWIQIEAAQIFKEPQEIPRFQVKSLDSFPTFYIRIRKHPLLLALPVLIYVPWSVIKNGGYKEGRYAIQSSVFWGIYNFLLCLKVWQLKKRHKSKEMRVSHKG